MLSYYRFLLIAAFLISWKFSVYSQSGDTLWVPVIFYDYHADGSNPNFEKNPVDTVGSRAYGMVQENLSADKKPLLNNDILYNDRIEEWYHPSGAENATFDYENNRWNGLADHNGLSEGEYVGQNYDASYDMATIVIYDSLPFIKDSINPNTFYFDDQDFFPIDGRGFGNEGIDGNGNSRNFSFAMELHWEFIYEPGLYFEFQGDDDVWAFINGQLVMDIGGIHGATSDDFYLDNIAESLGLVEGDKYNLDFFYAERHVTQSTIRITNNIISDPDRLVLSVKDTTIQAGQSIDISAQVRDKENLVMINLLDSISWRILTDFENDDITGVQTVLNPDSASMATFTGTKAHDSTMIEATVVFGEDTLRDTAYVSIVPGPLAEIILEHEDSTAMPDDTTLAPGDALTIVAAGYDAYGNRRGMGEPSNWTFSNNLHPVPNTEGETQIYYTVDVNDTTIDENGKIRATGVANPSAADEMNVSIKRSGKLSYAVTKDLNADGYLDAVELHFSKNVLIQDLNNLEIQYDYSSTDRINFDITSISPSDSGTVFMVHFDQDSSIDTGQTGWRPYINLRGVEGVSDTLDLLAEDGAGPVIWSVVKEIKSPNDRSKDKVTVTFSESIRDTNGANLNSSYYTPEELFHVWYGSDNTANCDSILSGISNTSHSSDKIEFSWENYQETGDPVLTANHYFTIDSSMNLIMDPNTNFPDSDNKKTKVVVIGKTGNLIIGPNPFVPSVALKDSLEYDDGSLKAFTVSQAENIQKTEGGTILQFQLSIPTHTKNGIKIDLKKGDVKVKSTVLVFDAIGNLTYSSQNDDNIIETDKTKIDAEWQKFFDDHEAGVSIELAYLWHGITNDGRMAAPGIYRIIVFLNVQYREDLEEDSFVRKFTDNVGIRR